MTVALEHRTRPTLKRQSLESRIRDLHDQEEILNEDLRKEIEREAEEDLPQPYERAKTLPVQTIRAGINWLAYKQPEDAVVSQFGIHKDAGCYRINVTPDGILILTIKEEFLRTRGVNGAPFNKMDEHEVRALRRRVLTATYGLNAVLASGIQEEWNGVGATSISFRLNACPESGVGRAYSNYDLRPWERANEPPKLNVPKGWE